MGIQFFGEFLIDRWVITRDQLIEALELQDFRNMKFGETAILKNHLTQEQAEQIHKLQRIRDKEFADLAVSERILSETQAKQILIFQRNNHLYLGEALLELGHITEEILERELSIFQEEQAEFVLQPVFVPFGVLGEDLIKVSVDFTRKMFKRVVGIPIKVDKGVLVGEDGHVSDTDYHLVVSVSFYGAESVRYVLSVSSQLAVSIASAVLKEDATRESEKVVEDAVKEFCIIVCGNSAAKLAQMGVGVELSPPESLDSLPKIHRGIQAVVFPVRLDQDGLDLRFLASTS